MKPITLPLVDTSAFESAHMRKPRGHGIWAFGLSRMASGDAIYFTHSKTYAEACAEAKKHFLGCSVIFVLP